MRRTVNQGCIENPEPQIYLESGWLESGLVWGFIMQFLQHMTVIRV